MKLIKRFVILACCAMTSITQAAVIDFNSNGTQSYFVRSVASNGFIATPTPTGDYNLGTSDNVDGLNFSNNGTVYLTTWSNSYTSTGFLLENLNNELFSLQSFDFDNAYSSGGRTSTVFAIGTYANNRTVTATFAGLQNITDWTTLSLGSGFTGLKYVTFVAYGEQNVRALYDNIVVNQTAIPEPTSIALLGLGLAGLVISRRKKA